MAMAIVYVADSTIETVQDTSGGIHVAGGGTLYASNLTVTTQGESSAAIRSDRGGGLLVADGRQLHQQRRRFACRIRHGGYHRPQCAADRQRL